MQHPCARVVIKGDDIEAAVLAAADRGLVLSGARLAPNGREVIGRCQGDARRLVAWFGAERGRPPYPAGALLLFSWVEPEGDR